MPKTSYEHDSKNSHLNDLHQAMDYTEDGKPAIRVLSNIQGDIIIEGDVNIPGTVTVNSSPEDPVHNHITEVGTSGILTTPYLPIGGTVTVNQPVAVTDNGGSLTVDGTVTIQDGGGSITVDGNVGVTGDVNVTQGTDPWNVTGNVNATIVGSPVVGSNKPFYLEVAQGLIAGYSFNHKFGAVPSMSGGTIGTVWDINDTLYPWDALGNGSIVNIERNDAGDNGITVTVQGLDENYNFASESIVITGADQTGSQLFTRVNRAFITGAVTNAGDIDIEAGSAGGTTVARITEGYGQTLMAVYTVPAGKTGYLLHGTATGSSDTDAEGRMMVRYFGNSAFRIGHAFELQLRGGQYDYTFATPIPIPEKTDIDIRVSMRSNNKRVTAAFDILLVDNT